MLAVSHFSQATPLRSHRLASAAAIIQRRAPNLAVSAAKNDDDSIGGLGVTILTALQSDPKLIPAAERDPKPGESDGGDEPISGSDVLRAMRKAADRKSNRKKKAKKGVESALSSAGGSTVGLGGDGEGEIRPLDVKSEWGQRLEELEKRFEELSQTK